MSLTTETEENKHEKIRTLSSGNRATDQIGGDGSFGTAAAACGRRAAGDVLMLITSAHNAWISPTLGLLGMIGALTLCMTGAFLTIWLPLRIVRVYSTIGENRRGR